MLTGNGILKTVAVGLLTAMSLGALTTALGVWKQADSHATKLELAEAMSTRDREFSSVLNRIGSDMSRIETKLDMLLEERKKR